MGNSYEVYFTLVIGEFPEETVVTDADGNVKRFESYEEAYDQMCNLYRASIGGKHYTYVENPVRPVIWRTVVTTYNGHTNMCSQKA